jgi:hypothetical protein
VAAASAARPAHPAAPLANQANPANTVNPAKTAETGCASNRPSVHLAGRAVCDAALSTPIDERVAVDQGDRRRVADDTPARWSVAVTLPVSWLQLDNQMVAVCGLAIEAVRSVGFLPAYRIGGKVIRLHAASRRRCPRCSRSRSQVSRQLEAEIRAAIRKDS